MENTQITYMYKDADNYKQTKDVVVAGKVTKEEIQEVLADHEFFIPEVIGWENLSDRFGQQGYAYPTYSDHPYHTILECEPTDQEPTEDIDVNELLERFSKI